MPFKPLSTNSIRISDETARKLLDELLPESRAFALFDEAPTRRLHPDGGAPPFISRDDEGEHRYRIIQRIAGGGMGVVYEAEQQRPRRTVALKVIRAELATDETVRRFSREAKALARLNHPGVAQIYETGAVETPSGPRPFLAMEMIHGEPITRYADNCGLIGDERIAIFLKLCDAAEHMHGAGVVHRDLKPDNVLVDRRGQPRIIDFGVAMVADPLVEMTVHTSFGQLLGTMPYMSPEQTEGDSAGTDARSDIYSLGVILFELLTGRLPYELNKSQPHECLRTIREKDPIRLSAANRAFRGDLDTIVAKSLEKDKSRRYQSASALGADLRRYLQALPIDARRPNAAYQLSRFVRRHRVLVIAATAIMSILVLGIVSTSIQAIEATHARQIAEQRSAEAERQSARAGVIKDFLQTMLLSPDPAADGRDVRVVETLTKAEQEASLAFYGQPDLEADVREMLGAIYHGLGLWHESRGQFEKSIKLMLLERSPDDPVVINTMHNLATVLYQLGELEEAETLMRRALDSFRASLGEEAPPTLRSASMLGMILLDRQRPEETADLLTATLEIMDRKLGAEHKDTLNTLNTLAGALLAHGRSEEALDARIALRNRSAAVYGHDDPLALTAAFNLARVQQHLDRYDEATELLEDLLPRYRRVMGPHHPRTLGVTRTRAFSLMSVGRKEDAASATTESFRLHERVLGRQHPDTIAELQRLAIIRKEMQDDEVATDLFREALSRLDSMRPHDPLLVSNVHLNFGKLLTSLGRFDEAGVHLNLAHDSLLALYGESHEDTRRATTALNEWTLAHNASIEGSSTAPNSHLPN